MSGDVIFNNTNTEELVGKTAYFNLAGRYVLSNHMTIIRIFDMGAIDSYWLAKHLHYLYGLGIFQKLCRRHVNQASVGLERLRGVAITLPPLPEQRAIAHALRTVQSAIEARRREIALGRERKAALMQHLFTHGTRGEPTKQTEIGEMPESWRVVKLGEVATQTQYGLSIRGNQRGSFPILRMNNLANGGIDTTDLQYIELDSETLRDFRLRTGDLLFNRTNSYDLVGKTGLFDTEGDFVFASYLVRVALDTVAINPAYLNEYLNWPTTQRRLKMLASRGVSQSNINASKLRGFATPLPDLQEQEEIANVLRSCDAKIAALVRESARLEELFRATLEELMTGWVRATALITEG